MSSATRVDIPPRLGLRPSRRLLGLASDERLVQQVRRGNDVAFEVAFDRHSPAILGFCRHMLGSPEEAEDAVQHTFAAAYGDLRRGGEREIALKAWLFAIARNRCLSLLRARREHAVDEAELVTRGLAEEVQERADLRQLLADLRELPDEQREALLLAETAGLPQVEIAAILGCEVGRVKGLVYRARSALVARREARELACDDVRQQLANLRGGSLRRNELRLHLRDCAGCRDFREQVRHQRSLLSVALPVAPTLGLKANVLAAIGIGGAGGGAGVVGGAGVAGGAAGGAAGAGALGGAAKVAAVAAIAIGGVGGGTAVVVSHHDSQSARPPVASGGVKSAPATSTGPAATSEPSQTPVQGSETPAGSQRRGAGDVASTGHGPRGAPDTERSHGGRGKVEREHAAEDHADHGRGPIETPAQDGPVRRGPPEAKAKPEHEHKPKVPRAQTQGPAAEQQQAQEAEEEPEQADHGHPNGED